MRPDMQLDYAVFQLTPNRTRCELHIAAQGMTYKLAAGLLKPFVAHLSAVEEQIARGGYTIRLEPPDPGSTTWFTKGTMERFVRFVSTPEVLERVGAVEMELMDIEESIRAQTTDPSEDTKTATDQLLKLALSSASTGGLPTAHGSLEQPLKDSLDGAEVGMEEARKQQLLRYLDARQIMLQKEQETAFVRAMAAGFNIEQIEDLSLFAENFGALRLREACTNFMVSYKKRQKFGFWQDNLSVTAAGQADMAFDNSSRGLLVPQGRGANHVELSRRLSLPGDMRLVMGDSRLEKLTRRGSLDELTGESWQVAARMRAAGMMDAATADCARNWQMPEGGNNQPINEEMLTRAGYMGSNSETLISEAGAGPVRGHHAIMPAWHHGHSEYHLMHDRYPLPLHPSIPPPLEMSRAGLPYAAYHGSPYITQAYVEANGWQMPPSVPPAYYFGHRGYNGTVAPSASENGDGVLQTQNKEADNLTPLKEKADEEMLVSAQRRTTDQVEIKDREESVSTPMQRAASDMRVCEDKGETVSTPVQRPVSNVRVCDDNKGETVSTASTQRPACDVMVGKDPYETVSTPMPTPANTSLVCQKDGEPHMETMRRLPIRSSSPSRRSASPLKKVQIGRSGPKKPGILKRNTGYSTQDSQNQGERENNDRESSGSWSEDDDDIEDDKGAQPEPARARVQDVIGLFESKRDSSGSNLKPFKKETRKLPSENSVLSRWQSATLRREGNDAEEPVASNQSRRVAPGTQAQTTAGIKLQHQNVMRETDEQRAATAEKDTSLVNETQRGSSRPKDYHSTAMLDEPEQGEELKLVSAGGTCTDLEDRISSQGIVDGSDQLVSDDSFIVLEQPIVGKEANWKMPLILESGVSKFADGNGDVSQTGEMPEHDDRSVVSGQNRSSNTQGMLVGATVMADDTNADQKHGDHKESPCGHELKVHETGEMGDTLRAASSRKVSERDTKAQAMQELLERRKAASGNRSGKPNPLAEAQLRAEKLRAYKAGLQKNKQEKEEEEKKRIEDLKSQRKERIAARGSPAGTAASHSPSTKSASRVSSLGFSKPSETAISQKPSSSSPPSSINASATALSPDVSKIKAAGLNKAPRTSGRGATKANENALSRSVPSLSELKKEGSKIAVRSSTGSQRLSQLKKSLKDADPNASPNSNGHSEEKKRPSPMAAVRKGIPPAKDVKGESLSVAKSTKGSSNAVSKQSKKVAISPKVRKPSPPKEEHVLGTEELVAPMENTNAVDSAALETLPPLQEENEADADAEETRTENIENNTSNVSFSLPDNNLDSGYAQIRAPASTELIEDLDTAIDDLICLPDESKLEHVSADDALKMAEETSDADPSACPASQHTETEDDLNAGEAFHAPTALMLPKEDNLVDCQEMDDHKEALSTPALTIPLAEDYNPPLDLPSLSSLHTPSKDLPRLHEAMQQAHSPEFSPGVGRMRKNHSDSGSQKASKDHHAKGLKRLLLLGRKSHHRGATQNPADGATVAMTFDADEEGEDVPSSIGKSGLLSLAAANVDSQADKVKRESNTGSSSGKGSRSFFSLSNFRGKSDGKS